MDDEIYSFALKNTLDEMRNVCPDISNAFMFREDGEIVAGDEETPEKTMVRVVDNFDGILERAEAIGGLEGIVFEGSKGTVNVLKVSDLFLVTVTSQKADLKYVNTVTHVLVPTIIKLLEKIRPAPLKNTPPKLKRTHEVQNTEEFENLKEELLEEAETEKKPEKMESELPLPEAPVNQLIVENLGGLLVPSDTVRIDSEILAQWEELYEGKKLVQVEVEAFNGKTIQCKVKPLKGSKFAGKGVVQVPEKMQADLEIKKGELVRVRPVVD